MSDAAADQEPLFAESGASWWWLLGGPLSAVMMLWIQRGADAPFSPAVPGFFLILLTFVLAVQVRAARLHTSVELTPDSLREGTETILVSEIERVYPPAKVKANANRFSVNPLSLWRPRMIEDPQAGTDSQVEKWQTARSLGELSGVPKGRTAIGLKLTNGRTAQAWARDHEGLRAKLTELLEARQ